MKTTRSVVQLYLLVWTYILIKMRGQEVLMFVQVLLLLFAAILVIFMRITEPLVWFRPLNASPVDTISAFEHSRTNRQIRIGYAPKTKATTAIVNDIKERFLQSTKTANVSFEGFLNEAHLIRSYCLNHSKIHMGLVFRDSTTKYTGSNINSCRDNAKHYTWNAHQSASQELPHHLEVVIRPSPELADSGSWHTDSLAPRTGLYCQRNALKDHSKAGVILLLRFAVEAIIKYKSLPMPEYSLHTMGIECPQQWIDPLQNTLAFAMPIVVSVLYLPCAVSVACKILNESNANMRRTLSMVGVHGSLYSISWVICVVLEVVIIAALATAIFFLPGGFAALRLSNPVIVFGFIMSYGLSVMSVSTWLTDYIPREDCLAAAIIVLHTAQTILVVYITLDRNRMIIRRTLLLGILTSYILNQGCSVISKHEETGEGVSWNNVLTPPTKQDRFSLALCLLMLTVNTGVFISMRLACRSALDLCRSVGHVVSASLTRLVKSVTRAPVSSDSNCIVSKFCEEDNSLKMFLDFHYDDKVFCSNHQSQWKSLHFQVYNNKTTVLLGFHEPDYSQVIRMLSGETRTSSATITVLGAPLQKHIKTNPCFIGVYFQQQAVFDKLSVMENIQLFAQLKGVSKQRLKLETVAQQFFLQDVLDHRAGNLSSYSSTMLRLAIASVGDPQMLFIEDPTRDLVQVKSHSMLRLLKTLLNTQTSVVTTACTDTAFQLADKIAVNIDGVTVCFGSKHFVHRCFGTGYRLEVALFSGCPVETLIKYMQVFVPNLFVLKTSETKLICLLPHNMRHVFEFLLSNLYVKETRFRIKDFQVNDIDMEEMLLKLRNYDSAITHLLEVEKYRSATETFSLETSSELSPRIISVTDSDHRNLLKQHGPEDQTLLDQVVGDACITSIEVSDRNKSILHTIRTMLQNLSSFPLSQRMSKHVDIELYDEA